MTPAPPAPAHTPVPNPVAVNNLVDSRDLDACLSYLSLVNGIEGAVAYGREGLVVAAGENSAEGLYLEGPYFLNNYLETAGRMRDLGLGAMEGQISFSEGKFWQILDLEREGRFFLLVSGTKGSFELFKFRIERGAQAFGRLLRERGYLGGG